MFRQPADSRKLSSERFTNTRPCVFVALIVWQDQYAAPAMGHLCFGAFKGHRTPKWGG